MCIVAGDIYYKDFNLIKHEISAGSSQERYSEGFKYRLAFIGSGEHVYKVFSDLGVIDHQVSHVGDEEHEVGCVQRSLAFLVAETTRSFMQEMVSGTKYKMVDMLREVGTDVEVIWPSA